MKYWISIAVVISLVACKPKLTPEILSKHDNGNPKIKVWRNAERIIVQHTEFYPSGNVKLEGKFGKEGQRQGSWKSYYENGILWSSNEYENGELHGLSQSYYPSGTIRYEGQYAKGQKIGNWIFYNEDGSLKQQNKF